MGDEHGEQSEAATSNASGLMQSLRRGWERESIAETWHHPLLTAIAVVVCVILGGMLRMKEVYWGAISTVVVMQSEVGPTVTASRDRFVGTLVGAVIGWLASLVWHGDVLVFGLAIAISLTLCGVLGLKNAGRLVGATICLVVLVPAEGPKWRIALDRFIEVSFGIVVAVVISIVAHHWLKMRPWKF
jgi:uncharacterized membrane protein YccC